MTRNYKKIFVSTLAVSLISTAGYAAQFKPITKVEGVADAPQATPYVKVGNAYEVNGVKYEPKVVDDYDIIGIASWYGEQFHGKKTANGELYDMNELTAAHPTLPLPSFVEVTNVENGKKVILRVNDRGPFSKYRNIDISKKGAEILGFENQGTANVRIRLLADISKEAAIELNKINMQKNAAVDAAAANAVAPVASQSVVAPVVVEAPVAPVVAAPVSVDVSPDVAVATDTPSGSVSNASIESGDLGIVDKEEILKSSDSKSMKTISLIEPSDVKSYTPRGVFVQIGAYSDNNENIKKQVGSLSSVGVVSLQKVDVNGKDILRLRVGPYGSIDDAIKIKNNLVKLGYTNSRVIVEQ
ncbi:MAG: septal ring lytic transglycosylase RlpA family protein [Alphaproteobacteria bacterium]|jgi:rare lipoprotein A|nr:septal ring lytic transglycosylase RlpA family protein [Alphaproteobacteria bacterium]